MRCLGISCYFHDSAAALVDGGEVVAAAEEERFTRVKHDVAFPVHAARFCLERAGMTAPELDAVCFYEKPLLKLERTLATARAWSDGSLGPVRRQLARLVHEELVLEAVLERTLGYRGAVLYCEHHLSHAASAFFPSPFDEAAVLTVDGVGEWATAAAYHGRGAALEKLGEIRYPHSLGLLYTTITAYLGFRANSDEYKMMRLAGYGRPRYRDEMRRLLRVHADGSFSLDLDYFAFPGRDDRMHTEALEDLLGPPRPRGAPVAEHHRDVAASLQEALEEAVVGLARRLHRDTGSPRLCLAGGVALNGLANSRILRETPFEEVFVQHAAGDSGGAVGAALCAVHEGGRARREAPVERAGDYFDLDRPSPYMLLIPQVRPRARELIPAVTHVDGTARVQTVDRAALPRFHALLQAFGRRSGVPVLINTSFNVQGEPIVRSPEEAYACFQRTDIDHLAIGSFLVEKDV